MVSTEKNNPNRTPQGLGTLVDHVGSKMLHLPPGIHCFNQQDFGAENLFIRFSSTFSSPFALLLLQKSTHPLKLYLLSLLNPKKNTFSALVTGLSIRLKRSRFTSLVMGSKSTNLGLWGNPSTSGRPGMGSRKKHTKNALTDTSHVSPLWDDITLFQQNLSSQQVFRDPPFF